MTVEITPLTEQDIPGAVDCIQKAFDGDPYNRWMFSGSPSKFSYERNRASLIIRCRWGIRNAMFYVAKDASSSNPQQVLGVAMWLPPRPLLAPERWDSYIQSWLLWSRQIFMNLWYGRGGLNVKRYYIWKENQAKMQRDIWTDENGYYFCNIITVLPGVQGKGVGRKLFEEVTKKADQEGRRCYLESSRMEPNVKIYEKLGFHLVKEMECEEGGDVCKAPVLVDFGSVSTRRKGHAGPDVDLIGRFEWF